MKTITEMTDNELVSEWLACERYLSDPADKRQAKRAEGRQLEIEAEQDRRESRVGKSPQR